MGSGMPEIGSRISLISKADIRYEGKLFSVDPDECTIALSSVRSYGTEDRKTTYPVPAQNQVYEFILFRGSDIKDIRVLTTTIPNDPAIVQLSVPPSLSAVENQFESADGGDFRLSGAASSGNRMPSAPGASSRPTQTFQNSSFKAAPAFNSIDQVLQKHHAPVQNVVSEDGSRASTPSGQNAANKNSEPPARTSISSNKSDDQSQQLQQRNKQTYSSRDTANRSQQQYQNRFQQQQGDKPQYQQRYQQNRYAPQQQQQHQQQQSQQQQQQHQRYPQQPQSQYRDYNNRDYNQQRDNQYRNNQQQQQQHRNYNNDYREGYGGQRQYIQPLRGNVQRGGDNWNNYNQRRMNRAGQGGVGGNQNNYQSMGGYQNQNRRPRNTLKFEDDYDFEQANSQFEEMRSQLSKVKIVDDATAANGKLNGDADASKKEDSGNEVSGGEENDHEAVVEPKEQCYDKVKSFFDQISYEAIERSKGLTARLDWKTERKINSETFGQVALRRNANNYRRRMNQSGGGGGGSGGNGYYNNYQNNRNVGGGVQNSYRSGGYNNRLQDNRPRRQQQYNNPTASHEESKENRVVA